MIHVKIDSTLYSDMIRNLTKELGDVASFKGIIDAEATAVLIQASKKTELGDKEKIEKRYTIRDSIRIKGARTPQNKELVYSVKMGGKRFPTRFLYSDAIYSKIKKKLALMKKQSLARLSSAKGVWYQAAKKAGLSTVRFASLAKMEKAAGAQFSSYFSRDNLRGDKRTAGSNKYAVEVYSRHGSLLNKYAKGTKAISGAMSGRVKFYETNLKKDVFSKSEKIAKKYPNIILGVT